MKINDRVTIKDHDFLSDGYVLEVWAGACIIKLDEKAPNQYAWETDEVLMFNVNLTKLEKGK
jgi:hypothetical protein